MFWGPHLPQEGVEVLAEERREKLNLKDHRTFPACYDVPAKLG